MSPLITISLCGDVMTGRGIDQVLPYPCNPQLHEPHAKDAREYLQLAEQANGLISKPVDYSYIWGDAQEQWNLVSPDVKIINLETAVTTSDDYWPEKQIHYRMNPQNIECITAANIDCCALANNHVLDWGYAGLDATLTTLRQSGVRIAGAGINIAEAATPAIMEIPGKGRVLLFSLGSVSGGIPPSWAAEPDRAGVNLFDEFSASDIKRMQQNVARVKRENDIVIASIHWGPNWGYGVSPAQQKFAHALIDEARIDLIHGHSSHHVIRIENYRDRLIFYGCGDFLDDYEGISGHEQFRGDLGLIYFATIESTTGALLDLQLTPTQMYNMRVRRARKKDIAWLKQVINRESSGFGIYLEETEHHGHPSLGLSRQ